MKNTTGNTGSIAKTLLILFVGTIIAITLYLTLVWNPKPYGRHGPCGCPKYIARDTTFAIARYFADPENIDIPTIETLVEYDGMSPDMFQCGKYQYTPVISGTNDYIKVTVFLDEDNPCPLGRKYVTYYSWTKFHQDEEEGWH
jgi:hypothetical protein